MLAVAACLFYVFVYTLWLKRTSTQNIVIGGAAGAVPVLIGWSSVTGSLAWAPVVLFAMIFYWTPPHFWALAIKYRDDYAAADVPMLPVGGQPAGHVGPHPRLHLGAVGAHPRFRRWPAWATSTWAPAIVLGAVFIWFAVRLLRRRPRPRPAMRLFSLLDHLHHAAVRGDGGRCPACGPPARAVWQFRGLAEACVVSESNPTAFRRGGAASVARTLAPVRSSRPWL